MNKRSIIEQIQEHGAVAAHTTGRYVDMVNNIPIKVDLATPIYMAKDKIRKGDKIAIIDMDEKLAYICKVNEIESRFFSKIPTLILGKPKKVRLE